MVVVVLNVIGVVVLLMKPACTGYGVICQFMGALFYFGIALKKSCASFMAGYRKTFHGPTPMVGSHTGLNTRCLSIVS